MSNQAYRDSHKKEIKAYRDSHKKEIAAYLKAYRASHKKEIAAYSEAYDNSPKGIFKHRKSEAKRYGILFTLTEDWVIEHCKAMICEKTGHPLTWEWDDSGHRCRDWVPSIDRISSKLGYTPENCRIVGAVINQMKNEHTEEEFNQNITVCFWSIQNELQRV